MTDDVEADGIFDAHKSLIGAVTVAWNDTTHLVFWLFETLAEMPHARADAVFFAIRNDRTQRQIVRRLVKSELESNPELRDELLTSLNNLDELAETRNEATHTAWAMQMAWEEDDRGEIVASDPPKLVKMRPLGKGDDDFTQRFTKLNDDLTTAYSRLYDSMAKLRHLKSSAS